LTKKQFKHDFLRGLGSALLVLKTCKNPQQYYDIVHYGCLHNTTYDMQCEGDRGWYLFQAAQIVGEHDILKDVIARYARSFTDYWFYNQLTSILFNYAEKGNEDARSALYDKYAFLLDKLSRFVISKHRTYCQERDMFDWLCVWLTSLDGWSSFKRIVADVSEKLLQKNSEFFFSEWFYDNSKSKFGEKRTKRYLQKQATTSEYISIYLQKAQEWENHIYEKQYEPTLDEVIAGVDGERYHGRGLSMLFCRSASSEDLEKLLKIAMAEKDLTRQAELLWGLRRATTPVPEEIISELLQSENEDIRHTAFCIMGNSASPKAREYALSCLEKGEEVVNAISLLSKKTLPQDEQILSDAVRSFPVKFAECDWHSAFMPAEDAIRNMRGKLKTDLIQYLYSETYCGSCRNSIVRTMHTKKVLSEKVLQECRFDSNCDIRIFAERIISARKQTR